MIIILISFVILTYSKIIQISLDNYSFLIPRPTVSFLRYSLLGQSMKSLMIEKNNKGEGTITLDDTYKVYKYQMALKFDDNAILNNLSVYILSSPSWIRERDLSLGYHIIDESYSIVYNLYKTKVIDEYRFAFDQVKEKLYLGGIPNNTHLTFPYKGILKINETLPTWGFHLNSIIFNNSEYIINQPCIIHSVLTNTFISDDILAVIKKI